MSNKQADRRRRHPVTAADPRETSRYVLVGETTRFNAGVAATPSPVAVHVLTGLRVP